MLKNVAQLVHTRHRSVHNFLINLLVAMGRAASSCPSQQLTSITRCRTQTVSSPFGNSSNLIFSKAHQAATSMVARHYIRIRITPFQSTLIPNSHYMVDSPCVPSRPPFYWGYTSVNVRCGRNISARNGLLLPQGRQCSFKFVTPLLSLRSARRGSWHQRHSAR